MLNIDHEVIVTMERNIIKKLEKEIRRGVVAGMENASKKCIKFVRR